MSELELAAELLGAFTLGAVAGVVGLVAYGRRVMRRKLDALPGQLLATTATGRPVTRPPQP